MATNSSPDLDQTETAPISAVERLLGNQWILLTIGVLVPALSYATWGFIELSRLR